MKGLVIVFPERSLFTNPLAHATPADVRHGKYIYGISSPQNVGSDDCIMIAD